MTSNSKNIVTISFLGKNANEKLSTISQKIKKEIEREYQDAEVVFEVEPDYWMCSKHISVSGRTVSSDESVNFINGVVDKHYFA